MPMDPDLRGVLVCPLCGSDYVAGVTECSDCHVALVAPTAAPGLLAGDAVEAGTTAEGAAARGWRDALLVAGVAHRIARSTEAPLTYTLLVSEADRPWAAALAAVLEERPSLEARDAIAAADAIADAGEAPSETPEPDVADFDVPDLVTPVEVESQIGTAEAASIVLAVVALVLAVVAVMLSPWWGLAAAIAASESVRWWRVAGARRTAWERDNDAR